MRSFWGVVAMSLVSMAGLAQNSGVNTYSPSQLRQMATKLEAQESYRTSGATSETLEKYPGHFTMLAVRNQSGGAEVHQHYADIFFVIDGDATLTTGGSVIAPTTAGPGETRGTGLQGGAQQPLGPGSVVHISASTPHQLTIAEGHTFVYFVVKVKE